GVAARLGVIGVLSSGFMVLDLSGQTFLIVCLVAGVFGVLMLANSSPGRILANARKSAAMPAFDGLLAPHTISLSAQGFYFDGRDSTTLTRWRLYERVDVTERNLLFPMADQRVNVIPVHLLPAGTTAQALAAQCREWIACAGGGEQRTVVAYL